MNTDPAPSPATPPPAVPPPRKVGLGCIIGLVIVAALVIGMLTVVVAAVRAVRLGPEASDLREAVRSQFVEQGTWDPMVEVRLGPVLCSLGREFLIAAADDPDATAVLRAARAVQVGVYHVTDGGQALDASRYLRDTAAAMNAHGWSRVVSVVDGPTTVMVFVPRDLDPHADVEFGVVVRDDTELVLAVVRARVEPLLALVRRHTGQEWVERP